MYFSIPFPLSINMQSRGSIVYARQKETSSMIYEQMTPCVVFKIYNSFDHYNLKYNYREKNTCVCALARLMRRQGTYFMRPVLGIDSFILGPNVYINIFLLSSVNDTFKIFVNE